MLDAEEETFGHGKLMFVINIQVRGCRLEGVHLGAHAWPVSVTPCCCQFGVPRNEGAFEFLL